MSDTDTAYLAIIDDLEAEVKTLEMTLDGVKALYEQRIAALEARVVEQSKAIGYQQTRIDTYRNGVNALATRIAALEAAARGVYACVVGSANEPDPPSMMSQVCRVMRRTTQFERLAALLEEEAT